MGGNLFYESKEESVWELYGLRGNPFFTSSLLVKGGVLPIDSFYGREDELNQLIRIFALSGGSRTFVNGDIGVGKTSFVNFARSKMTERGFFSPYKEILVRKNWDANDFILNTLNAIYSTLRLSRHLGLDEKTFQKLEQTTKLAEIESGPETNTIPEKPLFKRIKKKKAEVNYHFVELLKEVAKEISSKTGKDLIIHYDNLDELNENYLTGLFEEGKEVFRIPNVDFVFVGNLTIEAMFKKIPKASSALSDTSITLPDFSEEEIEKILRKRIEALRIREDINCVIPYKSEVIKLLMQAYGGNIEHILDSLSNAITELGCEKAVILDAQNIQHTLRRFIEKRYLNNIQPRAIDVLLQALKHDESTNKQLATSLDMARSNTSKYIKELQENGCIYLRRKDGKDKYWSVNPKIKWLSLKQPLLSYS